jgi:sugar phosphate isomerase/epimerase
MEKRDRSNRQLSRRRFLSISASATVFSMLPMFNRCKATHHIAGTLPNSKFGGVQVGAITYSWRSMPGSADKILQYCIQGGISSIEMMGDVAEEFAGLPKIPARPPRDVVQSEEEKAAFAKSVKAATEAQRQWRLSLPMKKYEDLRKMYNDAGVKIHIVKFSPESWSDEEIDYSFTAAKTLGAKGVCNEISDNACKRLGPFAEKHGMYAIFHQHAQPADPLFSFDKFLEYSPAIMLNFDAGHFFGCTGIHPNTIIERLHKRIFSIHLKDKTGPKSTPANTNMPWGKGEMPIADVLKLIQKEKWPINCDIELEYNIPEDSNAVTEVKKCVEYCRTILT